MISIENTMAKQTNNFMKASVTALREHGERMVGGTAAWQVSGNTSWQIRSWDRILMREALKVVQGKHYIICMAYRGLHFAFSCTWPSVSSEISFGSKRPCNQVDHDDFIHVVIQQMHKGPSCMLGSVLSMDYKLQATWDPCPKKLRSGTKDL